MANFIQTKASKLLNVKPESVDVVKFESYKRKPKENYIIAHKKHAKRSKENIIDIKKIKNDVVKFGMSGFDRFKKGEAEIVHAVSLGAKPPKRVYKNYKELMEEMKQKKKIENEQKKLLGNNCNITSNTKTKKSKVGCQKLLKVYGKVNINDLDKNNIGCGKKRKL